MESDRIALLVSKYFEGETSIAEEIELKNYFALSDVSPSLKEYQPLFNCMTSSAKQAFEKEIPLKDRKANPLKWLTVAASVVVFVGFGIYTFTTITNTQPATELGTFDDPQVAYDETQKALSLLSNQVNTGIESVRYVKAYKDTKDKIFVSED